MRKLKVIYKSKMNSNYDKTSIYVGDITNVH